MKFDLNINVLIGVTSQLATFLSALIQSQPQSQPMQLLSAETPTPMQTPAPAPTLEAAESDKPRRTRRAKAETPAEAPQPEPEPETPAAEPEPSPEPEAPAEQPEKEQPAKELTAEDVREAMHRTRQRFEGNDYRENTDSEAYKKHHKSLTGMFKQIAAVLGAEKPSALPAEKRAQFIAECDALILDERGLIAPPPAPY